MNGLTIKDILISLIQWQNNKMKTTNKQKRGVRRRVELDQGVRPPGTRVFVSKKIYSRKIKHKSNEKI